MGGIQSLSAVRRQLKREELRESAQRYVCLKLLCSLNLCDESVLPRLCAALAALAEALLDPNDPGTAVTAKPALCLPPPTTAGLPSGAVDEARLGLPPGSAWMAEEFESGGDADRPDAEDAAQGNPHQPAAEGTLTGRRTRIPPSVAGLRCLK